MIYSNCDVNHSNSDNNNSENVNINNNRYCVVIMRAFFSVLFCLVFSSFFYFFLFKTCYFKNIYLKLCGPCKGRKKYKNIMFH